MLSSHSSVVLQKFIFTKHLLAYLKKESLRMFMAFLLVSVGLYSIVSVAKASVKMAVSISPTKTDAFIGGDGDGKADPGETIEYTVNIPNSGDSDAIDVTYEDTIDPNTTLVAGSLNVSPLAWDDSYETIGNTLLDVGTSAADPAVHVSGSLFDNDTEFLSDTYTLKSVEGVNFVATSVTAATEQGGTVTVEEDGNFSYLPAAGFTGIDNFDYILTDAGGLSGAGRVTITVKEVVWYVKNTATAGGDGRSTSPFNTLVAAQNASLSNSTIYVFYGDGTINSQNAGIILKTGQHLIGEGVALEIPVVLTQQGAAGSSPITLKAGGSQPKITNTSGDGVTVTNLSNVVIRGLNIAGTGDAVDISTTGGNSGSFELSNNTISSATNHGVSVLSNSSGTLSASIHDNSVNATVDGIKIQRMNGTVNIIAFNDNNIIDTSTGTGINIIGPYVIFDATPGGSYEAVTGGTTRIGQSGNGVGLSGMLLTSVSGDLSFTDLDIFASNGAGLQASSPSVYTGSAGFRITVAADVATVNATNGPALDLNTVTAALPFSDLDSSNSTTRGVSLFTVAGTISAKNGSTITNAAGEDFYINAGNAEVTYGGIINDTSGNLITISNTTGGIKSFTGAITYNGTGSGVSLTNNTGATINFLGGLTLSTATNPAFTATGGGTVNICDENPCNPAVTGTLVNTLTTTTATALNITNTTIGANNLEFRSISSNGGSNTGIILNTTGVTGKLIITGTGSAGSGGTIINKSGSDNSTSTGIGIYLNNTFSPSFNHMQLNDFQNYGILGFNVTGFTLTNSTINGINGTAASLAFPNNYGEGSIYFGNASTTGLTGAATITNSTIGGGRARNLSVVNTTGVLNRLTISGTTFNQNQNFADANQNLAVEARGTAIINATVNGSNTFHGSPGDMVNFTGQTGTNMEVIFQNNTLDNNHSQNIIGGGGITLATQGVMNFNVSNNSMQGAHGSALTLFKASSGTVLSGTVNNNTIGVSGTAGSGSLTGNGIFLSSAGTGTVTLAITNNQIRNYNGNAGIFMDNTEGSYAVNLTMTGNTVATSPNPTTFAGLALTAGAPGSTDSINVCAQINGNDFSTGDPSNANDIIVGVSSVTSNMRFPGYAGTTSTNVQDFLLANNNAAGTVVSAYTDSPATAANYASCAIPPLPITYIPTGSAAAMVALDKQENSDPEMNKTQIAWSGKPYAQRDNRPTQQVYKPVDAEAVLPTSGVHKALLSLNQPAPAKSGESINVTIGDLPAGKSVTIKYQVTVNSTIKVAQIVNQGNIGYTGAPVGGLNTIDPSPNADAACSGAGTQTCTATDRPDTTIASIIRAASNPTNLNSVSWTVTFANPLDGLTSANFALVNSGLSGTPAITAVSGGTLPSATWIVTASSGTGTGTLGLNLINNTDLTHEVTTTMPFVGEVFSIDKIVPTITSFTRYDPSASLTNADTLVFEVLFSELLAGIETADFAVDGTSTAEVTALANVNSNGLYRVTVSGGDLAGFEGEVGLNFSGTAAMTDAAGNTFTVTEPATDEAYTLDNSSPTVSINQKISAPAQADPTASGPIHFTVVFSEPVTGFATGDVTLSSPFIGLSQTITEIAPNDGTTYNVSINGMTGNGTITATISAGVALDQILNPNEEATFTDNTVTYDDVLPDTSINSSPSNPTSSTDAGFTFSGTDSGTGVASFECNLDSGGFGTCTSPKNYSALSEGSHTFQVRAKDGVGNVDASADSFTWIVDHTAPETTITSNPGDPSTSADPSFSFTGDDGSGTGVASFECDLDSVGFSPCTSPQDYTGLSDGSHTFQVRAVDVSGNTDATPATFTWTVDTTGPSIILNRAATQPDPTNSSPINFTVVFSEPVSGFGTEDIDLSGSAGAAVVSITEIAPLDDTTFNIGVSGMTQDGSVTAKVLANSVQDALGNFNAAPSTSTDDTVIYDSTLPTVTINQAAGQTDPTGISPIHFTVVFAEPVTGFTTGDVTLSGTAGATTAIVTEIAPNDGTTYDVAVSGMTTGGEVIASIEANVAMDAASNGNTESTGDDNSVVFIFSATTTTITSAAQSPSIIGETVTFYYTVTANSGSGTPTGNVIVSDGTNTCTGSVAAGACAIQFTTSGTKALTATYEGDAYFNGSTSMNFSHIVNNANPTIFIYYFPMYYYNLP